MCNKEFTFFCAPSWHGLSWHGLSAVASSAPRFLFLLSSGDFSYTNTVKTKLVNAEKKKDLKSNERERVTKKVCHYKHRRTKWYVCACVQEQDSDIEHE